MVVLYYVGTSFVRWQEVIKHLPLTIDCSTQSHTQRWISIYNYNNLSLIIQNDILIGYLNYGYFDVHLLSFLWQLAHRNRVSESPVWNIFAC